ncbi:MAG: hypothetical protein VX777_01205 [Chlamydiota bacterium]|nr:hypothetical protein [Chlamydiota bacterium]
MTITSQSYFKQLQQCIKKNVPFSIDPIESGNYRIIRLSLFRRLQENNSSKKERIKGNITHLKKMLKALAPLEVGEAEKNELVKITKVYLSNVQKRLPIAEINSLKKQLLATRLSISTKTFKENEGLYEFAFKNYLPYYMAKYGHSLEVDSTTNKVKIMSKGVMQPWEEVRKVAEMVPTQSLSAPSRPWKYGPEGVQNEDMYNWSELKPYKYDDPTKWNNQWIFEACACNEKSPRKNGDHSWFRLKTPTGEIYSIGIYRPGKGSRIMGNLKLPFRVKKGYLMQPDLSEFYPCTINTISYAINEEIFNRIKEQVELDKAKDEELFQVMGMNCTLYVKKFARIAGINLPTEKAIWRLITPKALEGVINVFSKNTSVIIRKICEFFVNTVLNFIQLVLGAGAIDKSLSISHCRPIKPHFSSIVDIFKKSKARIHHPHTLGQKVAKEVNEWRYSKIADLSDDDVIGRSRILYDVPPHYKVAYSLD